MLRTIIYEADVQCTGIYIHKCVHLMYMKIQHTIIAKIMQRKEENLDQTNYTRKIQTNTKRTGHLGAQP